MGRNQLYFMRALIGALLICCGCARVMVPVYLPIGQTTVSRRVDASFEQTVEAVEATLAELDRRIDVRRDPAVYERGYDDVPEGRRVFLATKPRRVWKGPVRAYERINIIISCRTQTSCEVEWWQAHVAPLGLTAWVDEDPGKLARRFFSLLGEKLPMP